MATLWEYGLFLDDEPAFGLSAIGGSPSWSSRAEHARVLGRLLPGWPVLIADGADLGGAVEPARPGRLPEIATTCPGGRS